MAPSVHSGCGMGLKGKQWAWRACVPWLFVSGPSLAQNADTLTLSGGIYDDQGTLQLESPSVGEADSWYLGVGSYSYLGR